MAKQIHNHIQSLLDKYPSARGPYEAPHVIVNEIKIMEDLEWVELYNPLSTLVNLTDTANFSEYYIGDAENLTSDDEGLYHFPSNTEIPAHGYIVIANNGTLFYQTYGFYPDFEFEDTTIVPDMIRYDPTNFTGTFNLDDLGDEVLLVKRIYAGHLQVLDAVWYGNSNYLTGAADITGLNENNTLQRVEDGLDAVTPNYVFVVGDPTPKSGKAKGTPPLDVRLEEYVSYTFNCTPNRCKFQPIDAYGYLNITNYDPTNNTFFDIWVSVNLSTSFVSVSKPPLTNVVITTNQNDVPSKY